MKRVLAQITPRQALLVAIIVLLAVGLPLVSYRISPAWRQLESLRAAIDRHTVALVKLRRNLALKQSVGAQFELLNLKVEPEVADELALAEFFRAVEALVQKRPGVRVVSMKPQPVKAAGVCKDYHIKLVVAGKLQEVLELVGDLTGGPAVMGLESFTLRGVQGADAVECSLTLYAIRLVPEGPAAAAVGLPAARAGEEGAL